MADYAHNGMQPASQSSIYPLSVYLFFPAVYSNRPDKNRLKPRTNKRLQ
jgi:hypothetical protein